MYVKKVITVSLVTILLFISVVALEKYFENHPKINGNYVCEDVFTLKFDNDKVILELFDSDNLYEGKVIYIDKNMYELNVEPFEKFYLIKSEKSIDLALNQSGEVVYKCSENLKGEK